MKRLLGLAFVVAGCNAGALPGEGARAPVQVCSGDRAFSLRVTGQKMDRFEGKRVWVSAVEPSQSGGPRAVDQVAVFLEGRVTGGAVQLACERGLSMNYVYPSLSLAVDADGDGICSAGDLHATDQFYGWNADMSYLLTGTGAQASPREEVSWQPIAQARPVWDNTPICSYYFAATAPSR